MYGQKHLFHVLSNIYFKTMGFLSSLVCFFVVYLSENNLSDIENEKTMCFPSRLGSSVYSCGFLEIFPGNISRNIPKIHIFPGIYNLRYK